MCQRLPFEYTNKLLCIKVDSETSFYPIIYFLNEDGYEIEMYNQFNYTFQENKKYIVRYEQTSPNSMYFKDGVYHYHKTTGKWILNAVELPDSKQ